MKHDLCLPDICEHYQHYNTNRPHPGLLHSAPSTDLQSLCSVCSLYSGVVCMWTVRLNSTYTIYVAFNSLYIIIQFILTKTLQ